jgi:hypothetical protein
MAAFDPKPTSVAGCLPLFPKPDDKIAGGRSVSDSIDSLTGK